MANEIVEEFWKVQEFFNNLREFLTLRRTDQHFAKKEIVAFPTPCVYAECCISDSLASVKMTLNLPALPLTSCLWTANLIVPFQL